MAHYPQSTHQHQQLFTKNHRLYQQLIQDDFPNSSPYSPATPPTHAATIKFARPTPTIGVTREPQYAQQPNEFSPKLPRSGGLFKVFEPSVGRISNHATQSLSSNYCITEHENEENSTVNLYSLSRNHIEPDLDLSRNPTAHIDPDDSLPQLHQQPQNNHSINSPILQASMLNNNSQLNNNTLEQHQSSQLESQNIKKYRSEEYSHLAYTPQQEEEEPQGKIPKVLADKFLKNDITKKFSTGNNSEHDVQSNFKTVLNQIHVVPYRINNQLKPYAYSLPIDNRQYSAQQHITIASSCAEQRRGKANSLNLRNSIHSGQEEEEIATTPARHLYFSNHTHLNNPIRPLHFTHSPHSEAPKTRPAPRSEPKYATSSNDRNNRSNSIECKSKPNITIAHQNDSMRNPEAPREHLEQSQVTKLFKNTNSPIEEHLLPQEASVIYESTGINVCCSLSRDTESQPNKINFMQRPKEDARVRGEEAKSREESPFFVSSIDMTKVSTLQNPKGSYKINPIQMIRELNQPESQRGIKLVGFPMKRDKF